LKKRAHTLIVVSSNDGKIMIMHAVRESAGPRTYA